MILSFLRRRWPETALLAALALVAIFAGLVWRSLAILLIGGVAVFAIRRRIRHLALGALLAAGLLVLTLAISVTIDLAQVSLFGPWLHGEAER